MKSNLVLAVIWTASAFKQKNKIQCLFLEKKLRSISSLNISMSLLLRALKLSEWEVKAGRNFSARM